MARPRNLHEREASRLNSQRGGGEGGGKGGGLSKYNPEEGELPTGKLNILNAWQLGELELEMLRAIWEECLEATPFVLSGVKTPCLEWIGVRGRGPWEKREARTLTLNYGLYWFGGEDRVHIRTHALAWRLAGHPLPSLDPRTLLLTKNGKPTTMDLSHQCNNRRCCNPDHLLLETHAENMAYKAKSKKRMEMELAADLVHYSRVQPTDNLNPVLPLALAVQDDTEDFLKDWAGLS